MRPAITGLGLSGLLFLAACTTAPGPDTGTAPPRLLAPFDAGAVPYAPQAAFLSGCGLSIGLDPRWTRKDDGTPPAVSLISRLDLATFRKLNPHPFNRISVPPLTTIQVLCGPAQTATGTTALYTRSYLAVLARRDVLIGLPEVTRARVPAAGSWNRILYRSEGENGTRFTVVAYASVHDGRWRLIVVRMVDPADSNRAKLAGYLDAGETHVLEAEGSTPAMAAEMKQRTGVGSSGALYPVRTPAGDLALAERVAATLR